MTKQFLFLLFAMMTTAWNHTAAQDKTALMEQRAKDIIGQMTVEEKINQPLTITGAAPRTYRRTGRRQVLCRL